MWNYLLTRLSVPLHLRPQSLQELLLKLALQMARDDYETRKERQFQGVQLANTNWINSGMYVIRVICNIRQQLKS